ncbi:hypothetical protein PZE06_00475 [Robertmurraya sp. DFI.2.37]|uniref:hypothetical protein n=1 Tax=Robertmurraya sp. DFI.2.37 TaxID=3031819 RepID=UPI0012468915|nr:hypothetical protein [Robertmurraya sp. DFI.2.37]MDF1506646.1 hypothetical protein [Robertmurraya sp. DFI.2.37]
MKNNKLRLVWITLNIFCYFIFIRFSFFVITHSKELDEFNQLSIWVIILLSLLFISIYGSYRIWTWMKEGKM